MKKIINKSVSEYTVWLGNTSYRVQPHNYCVVEDEVAEEFMKYYPTILSVEDVVEEPKPPEPKVKEPKVEEPKVAKKAKTIKEKISPEAPKKARVKKSKK